MKNINIFGKKYYVFSEEESKNIKHKICDSIAEAYAVRMQLMGDSGFIKYFVKEMKENEGFINLDHRITLEVMARAMDTMYIEDLKKAEKELDSLSKYFY